MKRLFDLDPKEVSLVARGANRKKFLVFKSEGDPMPKENAELIELINSVPAATMANVEKILKKFPAKKSADGKIDPKAPGLSDRAQAALKAVARIIAPFKDEITDDHLDAIQNEVGLDSTDKTGQTDDSQAGEVQMSMDAPDGVKADDHKGAMQMAQKSYMEQMKKLGYQKYPTAKAKMEKSKTSEVDKSKMSKEDDDEEDDDVEKNKEASVSKVTKSDDLSAFSVEQRSQLELIFKANTELAESNKELVTKNANLEKEIKHERDQRVLKEFQDRTKAFKHLGANTDELATVLKSLSETDKGSFEKIESILKAADEQIAKGALFGELGSRQGNATGKAAEQLDRLVDSVVQKSDGTKTKEQIYEDVCRTPEGKRLMAQSLQESQGVR